jgi:hypothetical protein
VEPPSVVLVASIVQLALGCTFLIIPAIGYARGKEAQGAAEADVVAQGFPKAILAENRVKFEERALDAVLPITIAACLIGLAVLNLNGIGLGRISSLVVHPILLVAGGMVTAGQVFTIRFLASAFRKSGDPRVQRIDVKSFVDAALRVFPRWFTYLIATRFVLVTIGSLVVIVLLSTPGASEYFS